MVRGHDDAAARPEGHVDDLPDRRVRRLHRLDRGREVSGVADHVGVRQVHDREVVFAAPRRVHERRRDAGRAHLRPQVVGRHLRRGHQLAVLAGERRLAPAVEEVRDVRVLLRLGSMELGEAALREDPGHRHDLLRHERYEDIREADLVLGEAHESEIARHACADEAGEVRLHERPRQLTRAVRTEVEEDHGVAVRDRRARADDARLE